MNYGIPGASYLIDGLACAGLVRCRPFGPHLQDGIRRPSTSSHPKRRRLHPPVQTGFDLLARQDFLGLDLGNQTLDAGAVCFLLTGYSADHLLEQGINAGAAEIFVKPIKIEKFLETLTARLAT